MGTQIVKQPDGLFAVWSTVVDDFIEIDATPEQIIEERLEKEKEKIKADVMEIIEKLEQGGKPYYQFTMTYEHCLKCREINKKLI